MNILHLFSGNLFSGAVEHALELAVLQQAAGNNVYLASDFTHIATPLPHFTVPVHDRRWAQKIKGRKILRTIIEDGEIQIIHAHSKAASALAHSIISGREPALVSTVHGRQHLHFKSKHTDPYGEKIIVISAALKEHLVEELHKKSSKITIIPNGLTFPDVPPTALPASPVISWIGRLSGPKGERAATLFKEVFPALLRDFPQLEILIAGDAAGPVPNNGDQHLAALEAQFGERVKYLGFVEDVVPTIENSSLIIGAGRVALRALGLGRNVLALGEAACEGLVTTENIVTLGLGNFGDTGEKETAVASKADAALRQFLNAFLPVQPQPESLVRWVREHYSLEMVSRQIAAVYREARMRRLQPKWLPVLMYHKIPDKSINTPHRIFVDKAHFKKHLHWMRRIGLVPVTFEDYEAVAAGGRRAAQWPKKPVILTFDDGYESVWRNAFPLMQLQGWRGVLYLLGTNSVKFNNWDAAEDTHPENHLMNPEQISDLLRAGWQCGAHTVTHPRLDTMPVAEVRRQISESKVYLEKTFQKTVTTFAYPYGYYNDAVVQEVWAAGFRNAVATDSGALQLEDDPFRIFRVNIFPEEGAFSFWKKTSAWYRRYYFRKRGK